jgi:hypothetical protein
MFRATVSGSVSIADWLPSCLCALPSPINRHFPINTKQPRNGLLPCLWPSITGATDGQQFRQNFENRRQ